MITDPKHYNLNSRTKLEEISENHIGIVKRVKSRIIQKDAAKIIEMSEQINAIDSSLDVSLICNDNICSKSLKLLGENGIGVIK